MLKKALLFGVISHIGFINLFLHAQNPPCVHALRLQIVQPDEHPLIDAEVFIEDLHLLQKTDARGFVFFTNLCDTMYEIDIWYVGKHIHLKQEVQKETVQVFWEVQDSLRLSELHIVQHHTDLESDHLHIQHLHVAPNSSISEKMAELPMLRLQRTGNSIQKPMLQGLAGLRLPLFQDGMRIQGQAWGSDHAPELGRLGAQEISIHKGAQALKYSSDGWGNYLSVSYRPKVHAFEDNIGIVSGYQHNARAWQNGLSYSHGGSQEHEGFYLSAQHQNTADYSIPEGVLPNTAYRETSVYSGISYPFKNSIYRIDASYFNFIGGIYLGSHIGNTSDLINAINAPIPLLLIEQPKRTISLPRQEAEHTRISLERVPQNPKGISYKIGYQRNQRKEFDPHRNSQFNFPQLYIWVHSIQSYIRKALSLGNLNTEMGLQHEYRNQDWGGYYLAPAYKGHDFGAFICTELPKRMYLLEHNFTLRYDHVWRNTQIKSASIFENFTGLSAAYSLIHKKGFHKNEWHASIGQRAPSVNEKFSSGVHHGSASYEEGNPTLPMERGLKLDWEHQYRHKSRAWRTNIYVLHAENYIHLNPQNTPLLTIRGAFPHYIYESLPSTLGGINAFFMHSYKKGNVEIQIDAVWGRIWKPSRFPTQIPAPSARLKWEHRLQNWTFSWNQSALARMPFYTPGTDLMPPPKGYFLSDVFVHRPFHFKGLDLQMTLGIQNIFNTRYRDYLDRFRYFTPQIGRNFSIQLQFNLHHHRVHIEKLHKPYIKNTP